MNGQQTILPSEPNSQPEPTPQKTRAVWPAVGAVVVVLILGALGAFFLGKAPVNAPSAPLPTKDIQTNEPSQPLALALTPLPAVIAPLTPVDLNFKIVNVAQNALLNFNIIDERVLHLVIARNDLRYFFHLHPRFETNTGEFSQTFGFPTPGEWLLIVDASPTGYTPVTLSANVLVDGPYVPQPLAPGEAFVDSPEIATIDFSADPRAPAATKPARLTFTLNDPATLEPLTDLKNYLGAAGHAVIIKENTFESTHLAGHHQPGSANVVSFDYTFLTPGRYRVFAQFNRAGQIFSSFNTLDVHS